MRAERITSRRNPLVARLRRLGTDKRARRAEGAFLCEGGKLVGEALRWGPPPELLAVAEGTAPPAELPPGCGWWRCRRRCCEIIRSVGA